MPAFFFYSSALVKLLTARGLTAGTDLIKEMLGI
jgi:hypothetical protein